MYVYKRSVIEVFLYGLILFFGSILETFFRDILYDFGNVFVVNVAL